MPQALANILLHTVFSTKHRQPFLADASLRSEMHAYLGGVTKNLGCQPLRIGGTADHVHLLTTQSRTLAVADCIRDLKRSSSLWVKERNELARPFHWQSGYGVFSIGPSESEGLKRYIDNQEEHHRSITFQEEYRRLLDEHGMEYDERYVWD